MPESRKFTSLDILPHCSKTVLDLFELFAFVFPSLIAACRQWAVQRPPSQSLLSPKTHAAILRLKELGLSANTRKGKSEIGIHDWRSCLCSSHPGVVWGCMHHSALGSQSL